VDVWLLEVEVVSFAHRLPVIFEVLEDESVVLDVNDSLVLVLDVDHHDCASLIVELSEPVKTLEILSSEREVRVLAITFELRNSSGNVVLDHVLIPALFEAVAVERMRNEMNARLAWNSRKRHQNSLAACIRLAFEDELFDLVEVRLMFSVAVNDPSLVSLSSAVSDARSRSHEMERRREALSRDFLFRDVLEHVKRDLLVVSLVETDVSSHVERLADLDDVSLALFQVVDRSDEVVLDAAAVHVAVIRRIRNSIDHRVIGLTTEKLNVVTVAFTLEREKLLDDFEVVDHLGLLVEVHMINIESSSRFVNG